jgi:hypothetical protein
VVKIKKGAVSKVGTALFFYRNYLLFYVLRFILPFFVESGLPGIGI